MSAPCLLFTCLPVASAADTAEEAVSKPFVASMGMYVIKRKVLQELLSTRFPKVSGWRGCVCCPALSLALHSRRRWAVPATRWP